MEGLTALPGKCMKETTVGIKVPTITYKLSKGEVTQRYNIYDSYSTLTGLALSCLDNSGLSYDEWSKNFNITFYGDLLDQLKEIGY